MERVTNEEKMLLYKLLNDDKFFCGFLSGKEKITFWFNKIIKKIR